MVKRRAARSAQVSPKIYYSLLLISYLEVVLWTSCLVAVVLAGGSNASDGSCSYLFRETSNLKFATQAPATPFLFALDFHGAGLHKQLEQAALRRVLARFQAYGDARRRSRAAQPLSSSYTKRLSGIPADFEGVDALD